MSRVLWIILVSVLCSMSQIQGFSITITRGYTDSMRANIRQTSTDGLTCSDTGSCHCSERSVGTYIFDSGSLTGKCVKDHEIIKDRSIAKFLPARNGKCIGVTRDDKGIVNLNCDENDRSVRWIWTLYGQMLNLKTLKCLKAENRGTRRIRRFLLEQCDMNNRQQKWECAGPQGNEYVKNNAASSTRLSWIKPAKDDSYFQICQNIYSYQGCYRFSDGNFLKLINGTRCDTRHNGTCGLQIKLQAPIGRRYTSCQLNWSNSVYTISGYIWYSFSEALERVTLDTAVNPITLEIKNSSLLLSKWKGHLLRLNIQCRNKEGIKESHCALLKVQGTVTEQIPVSDDPSRTLYPPLTSTTPTMSSTTSPTTTTSSTTSLTQFNPTTSITSDYQINMTSTSTSSTKQSSTGTSYQNINSQDRESDGENSSIILPVVISAVVLFCLLLAVVVMVIVCKRRQKKTTTDTENQNEEHIYEEAHPVDNGPVSPIYMEIDNIRRSKKSNSSKKRNKSQSNYQEPTESPFYHTLERPDGVENTEEIYEELDKVEKPLTPKAFEKEVDI